MTLKHSKQAEMKDAKDIEVSNITTTSVVNIINDDGQCTQCSLTNGYTLLQDNTYLNYSNPFDSYPQCPVGYQCAEQRLEDHYINDSYGCCEECQVDQICNIGAIALRDYPLSNICPDGYTCANGTQELCEEGTLCSYNRKLNCTIAVNQSLYREIFEGTYCREGTRLIEMCSTGDYCPNPGTKETCPAGSFCMRKSKEDWLSCVGCDKGTDELQSNPRLFILIISVVFLSGFIWFILYLIDNEYLPKSMKAPLDKIDEYAKGWFGDESDREGTIDSDSTKQRELALQEIEDRYKFQDMDRGDKGYLTFDDMNHVLHLSEHKFHRLQYCLLLTTTNKISQEEFDEYFPDALFRAQHIEPTEDDVMELFKKLDTDNDNIIKESELFSSYLSYVLEEDEIDNLVKKFRAYDHNGGAVLKKRNVSITQEDFVEHYPKMLLELTAESDEQGIEMVFRDLTMTINTINGDKTIVDNVTGKIPSRSLTMLMGGSGTGKTSLLNALSGRAYYANVSGQIYINGHLNVVNQMKPIIGFVPQDDIVYAELTVRENFIFAGRLRLPPGTTAEEIADLADGVVTSLGLFRVKDSIVGDVTRRGVSGGERKRVNIGLELMARPKVLFLDEPTSGLDSASCSKVMRALKRLTIRERITICGVLHQPRKYVFEQCDHLILLQNGGIMTYCGPSNEIVDYFGRFGYELPIGENVADFIIDVVAGDITPKVRNSSTLEHKRSNLNTIDLAEEWLKHSEYTNYDTECSTDADGDEETNPLLNLPNKVDLPEVRSSRNFWIQLQVQFERRFLAIQRTAGDHFTQFLALLFGMVVMTFLAGRLEPVEVESSDDINQVDGVLTFEQLYQTLVVPLNDSIDPVTFRQTALCNIYYFHDVVKSSIKEMTDYSKDANNGHYQFALQVGLINSMMIAITASKAITSKKLQFYREAASNYNILAFFIAIAVISMIEITFFMIACSLVVLFFRSSITSAGPFIFNFLLFSWNCTAWGLFYSAWVSPDQGTLLCGLHMILGAFLSGNADAIEREDMYETPFLNGLSLTISPFRIFAETYAVTEFKCLKELSGFTSKILYLSDSTNFDRLYLGQNDPNITLRSCSGWYWNTWPSVLITLCITYVAAIGIHVSFRTQMCKPSFTQSLKERKNLLVWLGVFAILITLYSVTLWSFTEQRGELSSELDEKNVVCDLLWISDDSDECDYVYDNLKDSDFFDVILNDKDSPDRKDAPTFCEDIDLKSHDFRNYLLNSADFF